MKHSRLAALLILGMAGQASDARACGGCFQPPSVDSVVVGHRMAFAISDERTVLWDQIQYTGDPEDFAWVLPIRPGATLDVSTDAWFESLEAVTVTDVRAPALSCAAPSGGSGCGEAFGRSASDSALGGYLDDGVRVLHRETKGPYDTVTLSSTNGDALNAWLDENGYAVPPDIEPVIDAYVSEGADFIALRLSPGKGVNQMTPVRVVTPSGPPILPLRMVAAGTGSEVDIVLFVIGEKRMGLADLTEVGIDQKLLSYDYRTSSTNYLSLREDALSRNEGNSYLPTFAHRQPFSYDIASGAGFYTPVSTTGGQYVNTLSELYFTQAQENTAANGSEPLPAPCPFVSPSSISPSPFLSDRKVVEGPDSARFSCGNSKDVEAAVIGMVPSKLWLTRLEMHLPREALVMDCNVNSTESQEEVSNRLVASLAKGRPPGCTEPLFESRIAPQTSSTSNAFVWGLGAFAAIALLRRRSLPRSR